MVDKFRLLLWFLGSIGAQKRAGWDSNPRFAAHGSPGSTKNGLDPIDWYKFDEYLSNAFHSRTQSQYRIQAKRYWLVLTTGDASPLLGLSDGQRRHAMAGLAALANFMGVKEEWKGIVTRYNLKWNGRNDLGDLVGLL
jgi:hypothetical protein